MKEIRKITFWRRDPDSVENLLGCTLEKQDGVYLNPKNQNRLTEEESEQLEDFLLKEIQIEDYEETYLAFRFENNKEDYRIKFFLEVSFSDCTYLCIKGLLPFKQPYYKEIIDRFSPYEN